MEGEAKTKSSCSNECKYLFYECEADGLSSVQCRSNFNKCVRKCLLSQ